MSYIPLDIPHGVHADHAKATITCGVLPRLCVYATAPLAVPDILVAVTTLNKGIFEVMVAMLLVFVAMFVLFVLIFTPLATITASCISFLALIRLGSATRLAHVPPVSVHAVNSPLVAISTLPATFSLALGFVPLALSARDHQT